MKLFLYNHLLDFDEYYLQSAKLYYTIHDEAIKCCNRMLEIYAKIQTLNDITEFSQYYKNKIYNDSIHSIILSVNTIFNNTTINEKVILDDYPNYSGSFESTFSRILNKYLEISNEKTAELKYKTFKKSVFSDESAKADLIKTSAQQIINSHANNLTLNEVNLILNSLSFPHAITEISTQMKALMNESSNISAIKKAVFNDIKNTIYPITNLLEVNNDFNMVYDENNFLKAQEILQQLENHDYNDITILPEIIKLIELSPYDPKSYVLPYYLIGDNENELETLANRIGVNINFKSLKDGEQNARKFLRNAFFDVETILKNNFFYKQTRDLLGKPLSTLLHECKFLFNGILQKKLITSVEKNGSDRFNELVSLYGCFNIAEENPLLILDLDFGNDIKDGFIITDQRIYFFSGCILEMNEFNHVQFIEKGYVIGSLVMQSDYNYFEMSDIKELQDFVKFLCLIHSYYKTSSNNNIEVELENDHTILSILKSSDYQKYSRMLMEIFYDKEFNTCIMPFSEDISIKRKFYNAIETYAPLEDGEIPMLCFDNTAFGSSKDGCLITNFGIHVHNSFMKSHKVLFTDIKNIHIKDIANPELIIDENLIQTTMLTKTVNKVRFSLILSRIYKDFLLLDKFNEIHALNSKKYETANLLELLKLVSELCSSNTIVEKNVFLFSTSPKTQKKFDTAIQTYCKLEENEIPYLCFDNTVFGSAKEGCLITNKSVIIHNAFSSPQKLHYQEIDTIYFSGNTSRDLFINTSELFTTTLSTYEAKSIFYKILNLFIDYFKNH